MLSVARREGQAIYIGGVTVTVLAVAGRKVRLGVEAPAGVPVLRDELVKPGQTVEAALAECAANRRRKGGESCATE